MKNDNILWQIYIFFFLLLVDGKREATCLGGEGAGGGIHDDVDCSGRLSLVNDFINTVVSGSE